MKEYITDLQHQYVQTTTDIYSYVYEFVLIYLLNPNDSE